MAISRRVADPVGTTNASGEPEIVLTVGGLTLSAMPPKAPRARPAPAAEHDGATDEGPGTPSA